MTSTLSSNRQAVELQTLGSLNLHNADGVELRSVLAQGKRMALLCYLAIAQPRGFHRRDTLVGLFWPETDQRHARAALRQALHFLRQSLGSDIVLSRGPEEIGIDFTKLVCDVTEFEACLERDDAERAAQLYGGPLLRGFFVNDAPEFERWLGLERDRIAQLYTDSLRHLAEKTGARGDTAAAIRWWKKLATHDPYSSEIACRLMNALDAAGDRVGAITHSQVHVETIRSELDVEPDDQVIELAQYLRTQPSRSPPPDVSKPSRSVNRAGARTIEPDELGEPLRSAARSRPRLLLATTLLLVSCAAVVFALSERNVPRTTPTLSLAVLPFENLGSTDDDYLAIGLAEDIVNRLAGVSDLSLIGPNDGGLDSHDEAGGYTSAGLSAEFLLRASVEHVDHSDGTQAIRIMPRLVRESDGEQIWSEIIENDVGQIFDGQIRIAEEVLRVLGSSVLSAERAWLRTRPTDDPVAYDLFLHGNDELRLASGSPEAAKAAVELFQDATTRDSNFVQAFAKLAIAHTSMFWWNHDRTPERLAAAKAAADHAVSLRPDIPNSHLALGWYYYWGERDYDRALRHFELARTNWPGVSDVLMLVAAIRRRQGDFERSLEDHHHAATIDPSCATCFTGAAFTHLMLRDYRAAEEDVASALEVAPGLSYALRVGALARLNSDGDTAAARDILPEPENTSQMIAMGTGHWSAIPRILGGECDVFASTMVLNPHVADTAGFFLIKAELANRHGMTEPAVAYYDSARTVLVRQIADLPDDPTLHSQLGLAYAGLGLSADAVREGVQATRLRPISEDAVDGPLAVEMLARIYTILGNAETAIDRLEMLLSVPSHLSKHTLRLDPVWAPLRLHERFLRLTR